MAPTSVQRMEPMTVQPMEPRWLKSILLESKLNKQTVNCIIAALKKYNRAVNAAGHDFEHDLKNCLMHHAMVAKPIVQKKKSLPKK
jgi:hypothetical protein